MLLGFIIVALAIGIIVLWKRGGFKRSYDGARGMMSSSKANRGLWMVAIAAILGLIVLWQWDRVVSLHTKWFGSSFPLWGYAAIVGGIVIVIWLLRMNKEQREKSVHLAEWIIGFAAIGGALVVFANWQKEDALCPDKQAITSVPAMGMVVDLQSCWKEPFVVLDLREVGITVLNFNTESASLQGRTVGEFAYLQTGYPGALSGHARLVFNGAEMRKYGMRTLPIFVGPSGNQPGATARFDDATLEALSK